jgi:N utilization substance protein B
MSANRHLGRIVVLQSLYEFDFRTERGDKSCKLADIVEANIARYKGMLDDKAFARNLAKGVAKIAKELDAELQPVAPDWPIDQVARIDHIVLQMGLYELRNLQKTPAKVVINEAVELAKAYGGDNSSRFVNGVLGTLYRQLAGDQAETADTEKNSPTKSSKDTNSNVT